MGPGRDHESPPKSNQLRLSFEPRPIHV